MNTTLKYVEGHVYPEFDSGWGGCAEELFHHTSRYYAYTEAFLRNLSGDMSCSMADYQATDLSDEQRRMLAVLLAHKPDPGTASDLLEVVNAVRAGKDFVSPSLIDRYHEQLESVPQSVAPPYTHRMATLTPMGLSPLEPFLNLAERLRLPVAVNDHHIEVSLLDLAQYLDSPQPNLRTNLLNLLIELHSAGYLLHNHPGLTHKEAHEIGEDDAV